MYYVVRANGASKSQQCLKSFALLVCLVGVLCADPLAAHSPEQAEPRTGIDWLRENFSGPFTWTFIDPETGEETTGKGDCKMVFGGRFLECTHLSPDGEPMGVGVSGFHEEKQRYQWTFYGAHSSAMLHGEGYRDQETDTSYIEGKQKVPGLPEFTFRTVTKKISDKVWSYTHYRLDGDEPVEMFRARFSYER